MLQNTRRPLPAVRTLEKILPPGTRRGEHALAKPDLAGLAVIPARPEIFFRRILTGLFLGLLLTAFPAVAPAASASAGNSPQLRETIVQETVEQDAQTPDSPEDASSEAATAQTDPGKAVDAPEKTREGDTSSAPPPAAVRLFGTVEFRSLIKNLPKWEHVLNAEKKRPSFTPAGLDAANPQVSERWAKQKAKVQGLPLKEQIQAVNNFFNQWPYKSDLNIWGLEDYWATPREFVNKSGDCEDYAIAKYYALRDLGVPASKLRVAAVKDGIRNLGHAVLVVYMENDAYVLDNLTNLVLSHKKLTHYSPQYSVNEEFLWRHVKPKAVPKNK